jgi:hypothetical protein
MSKIDDELEKIKNDREVLIAAEAKLLAEGKPFVLKEIEQLIADFHLTENELKTCLNSEQATQGTASASTMEPRAIKKYSELLTSYPKYKQAHFVAKIEFLRPEHRVKANVSVHINHEFDQFLSWVYIENKLSVDPFPTEPLRSEREIYKHIAKLIEDWKTVAVERLEKEEAFKHLDTFQQVFSTEDSVRNSSDIKLHNALCISHSYRNAWKLGFDKLEPRHIYNPEQHQKLRNSLCYLLFNKDPAEVRISNMCFNPAFDIKGMGSSTISELIGWHNTCEPLINDRVVATLKFLGFDVTALPKK